MKATYLINDEQKTQILDLYFPNGVKKDVDVGFDPYAICNESDHESYIVYHSDSDILEAVPYSYVRMKGANEAKSGYFFDFRKNTLTYVGGAKGCFDHPSVFGEQIKEIGLELISLESSLYPGKIFTSENEDEYWNNFEEDSREKTIKQFISSLGGNKYADFKHLNAVESVPYDSDWYDYPDNLFWDNNIKKQFLLSIIPDWAEYLFIITSNRNVLVYDILEDEFKFIKPIKNEIGDIGIYNILDGEVLKDSDISEFFNAMRNWGNSFHIAALNERNHYSLQDDFSEEIESF